MRRAGSTTSRSTIEILDPKVAETLVATFERDMTNAAPYDELAWKRLPWWRKTLAWIGYRLRRLL